jgi:hypothetical protein
MSENFKVWKQWRTEAISDMSLGTSSGMGHWSKLVPVMGFHHKPRYLRPFEALFTLALAVAAAHNAASEQTNHDCHLLPVAP